MEAMPFCSARSLTRRYPDEFIYVLEGVLDLRLGDAHPAGSGR